MADATSDDTRSSLLRTVAVVLACGLLACSRERSAPSPVVAAPPQPRVIAGSAPPAVVEHAARVVRPLDPAAIVRLALVLHPPKSAELTQFVSDVMTPSSPKFHQFLELPELEAKYCPSEADISAVEAWAKKAGLKEVARSAANLAVAFDADVATAQRAFSVQVNEYELGDRRFYSHDRDPVLPAEVSSLVDDVLGLESYRHVSGTERPKDEPVPRTHAAPPREEVNARFDPKPGGPKRRVNRGAQARKSRAVTPYYPGPVGPESSFIEPEDIWSSSAYDYAALAKLSHCCNPTNASGGSSKQTSIAIVGTNKPLKSDYDAFVQTYNLALNLTEVRIDGPSCCDKEMTMDLEWTVATSNSFGSYLDTSHIYMYEGGGTLIWDLLSSWLNALGDDNTRVLTSSFFSAEQVYGSFWDLGNPGISDFSEVIERMAAMGWTMVIASGDDGDTANCSSPSVEYPSSDPNVIAAGGTSLSLNQTTGIYQQETAWSGMGCPNTGGGGGGCSSKFSAPPWEDSELSFVPCEPGKYSGGNGSRRLPDLSLNASIPQSLYYSGWKPGGGTSIVAPELAGFFAQANSYLTFTSFRGNNCGSNRDRKCTAFGPIAPALWQVAYTAPHNPFYDIILGGNAGGGTTFGYSALPGYDLATGWGSVNMLQLAWALNYYAEGAGTNPPQVNLTSTFGVGNTIYGTQPVVNLNITDPDVGIAGYTASWDVDPGDPMTHATPGVGDPFYDGPQVPFGTTGTFAVPAGCHTLYVRAWDNDGLGGAGVYGPLCFQTCATPNNLVQPVACGSTCCPSGDSCVNGACCPAGQAACGNYCCLPGLACLGGSCAACASGMQACGTLCCPANVACTTTECCPPNYLACGTSCCPPPP